MKKISYQIATISDIELLVQSRIDFLEDHWGKQEPSSVEKLRPELKKYFSTAIASGEYIAIMALNENKLIAVGGVVLRWQPGSFKIPEGKIGYIMNMYTIPEFRKQGISSAILDLLLEESKKRGYTVFELHATKSGEPVYIKNGFYKHSEPTYRKFITE
jgi:GNAT superfamily N-acetyltransferase